MHNPTVRHDLLSQLPHPVEHVPAVVFRLSHQEDDWRTLFVTRSISMFGYTAEEFMEGRVKWLDLVHPDDRVLVSKTVHDYEAHNVNSFRLYYRLIQKNGDSIPVTEYNTVSRDEEGNILCYDTTILSSSLAEDSRRVIDDHYRQQIVLNDILMSLHDSNLDHALQIILDRTGEYLDTSRALLFRDSADHTTCKIVYEWCNRDIESVMALDYSITYATGMPEIYIALQTTGNLLINFGEIPENCREEFEAEGLIASAIFAVYQGGDHYGFVCFDDCIIERRWDDDTIRFLKNISNLISTVIARQSAAEQIVQNQRSYEAVLNNVDSYLYVVRPDTDEIIFANNAFKQTFGMDCVGKRASTFIDISQSTLRQPLDPPQDGSPENYPELFVPTANQWIAISTEEIVWINGQSVQLVNGYDITSQKLFTKTLEEKIEERTAALQQMTTEAESARAQAEQAANAKSQFLANMSHEMRTPLNAIIGMTSIAKSTPDPERKEYSLEKIEEASAHLLDVINDILDMSKIEADKMELYHAPFDFEKMMMQVSNVMQYSLNQKQQDFHVDIDTKIPRSLVGDEKRLSQVLTNLLSNAVKFSPEQGEIRLEAKLLRQDPASCTLEISVRDHGIGISAEQQQKLFRSFEQADGGISRKYGGTGLGLAISRRLITLMGGALSVESTLGEGSVFTLAVPFELGEASTTAPSRADLDSVRILVIDGAADARSLFPSLADSHGFNCRVVSKDAWALEGPAQDKEHYDIAFVDGDFLRPENAAGWNALREIADVRILMIPALAWEQQAPEARRLGIDGYVPTPLFPSAVMDCIVQTLPKDPAKDTAASEAPVEEIDFGTKQILLVEDVEINREIVQVLLEPTSVGIDCAENGAEAVEMFAASPDRYDIIFMDIHMPEVDGYEATRRIRALDSKKAKEIPIIAMTANVFQEDIERCLASGMNDHIGKPIDIDNILEKMKYYLR